MHDLTTDCLLAGPTPVSWDRLSATNTPLMDEVASQLPDDPMSLALPWLVRHFGPAEVMALATELPAELPAVEGLTVLASELPALSRLGFEACLAATPLADVGVDLLPAVLLLRCGDACVLTGLGRGLGGQRVLHVVMPGQPAIAFDVPEDEIAREYIGIALFTQRLEGVQMTPELAAAPGPMARLLCVLHEAADQLQAAEAPVAAAGDTAAPSTGLAGMWQRLGQAVAPLGRCWRELGQAPQALKSWLRPAPSFSAVPDLSAESDLPELAQRPVSTAHPLGATLPSAVHS